MVKRLKLKKKVKNVIVLMSLLIIGISFLIYKNNLNKYHNSYEYKLIQVGYTKEDANKFINILEASSIDTLLNTSKDDSYVTLISEKYFLKDNFDNYVTYYNKNTDKTSKDIVSIVNVGADKDWYTDTKKTEYKDDYTILVNKFNLLESDYEVNNIKKFSSTYAYGSVSAEETCYNAFISMAKAAKEEDITLILTSGYRSYNDQESVYNSMAKSKGTEYADAYAARPGASEHETGLALDVFSTDANTTDKFKYSDAYKWLQENAANYGFIERYQEGKEYITGYSAEAWHWRYVGIELAKKIKKENITYDEYYAYYLNK